MSPPGSVEPYDMATLYPFGGPYHEAHCSGGMWKLAPSAPAVLNVYALVALVSISAAEIAFIRLK